VLLLLRWGWQTTRIPGRAALRSPLRLHWRQRRPAWQACISSALTPIAPVMACLQWCPRNTLTQEASVSPCRTPAHNAACMTGNQVLV